MLCLQVRNGHDFATIVAAFHWPKLTILNMILFFLSSLDEAMLLIVCPPSLICFNSDSA
jgi:hypothetical protein